MVKKPGPTQKSRYLFLLRHAKAAPSGLASADFERPLTERGLEDAAKMAALLVDLGVCPDRVLCSPSVRTRQTLEQIALAIPGLKASYPAEMYLIGWEALLSQLRKQKDEVRSVLVVGHNPGIEELAMSLADPNQDGGEDLRRLQTKFPTAALAVLKLKGDWKELEISTCRLEAFVRPKDVAATE
ncbi:MAG: histidine phosphatase family protein [Rhodospirillales bacterium]|jgi:phosphohistidine phosphatase